MKFTRNERKVLEYLIENAKITDSEIAEKLHITSQAVGKIRKKLEIIGIIKGYHAVVDLEKTGIKVIAIGMFKFNIDAFSESENIKECIDTDITKRIQNHLIINFYRLPEGNITHIVVYGFKSVDELDSYFHALQAKRGHISELKNLYILSIKSMKKSSPNDLLVKLLKED
ncbi:MAG: winged helix-turn-helix transcriptional regulator [Candidatus Altarchaeum sp.]|nr:winged helix-turn-helix transcriptional regulator [Candidatus Altarchaeum sp.]